eukprot:scaffold11448_cov80-Skeletonema_menzelii.AAC.2
MCRFQKLEPATTHFNIILWQRYNEPPSKKTPLSAQESPTKKGLRVNKTSKKESNEPFPDIIFSDLGVVDPIQPDHVISAGTVDGNNNRAETVTNLASIIWKRQKRLQDVILKLQNVNPKEFCYELMLAVYKKQV